MDMMVTAIEPYPKGKGRVAVYLNDKFAFVMYKGELSEYGLDTGAAVDDGLYSRIMNEVLIPRAKKRAMNLIKTIDRTEEDVRRRLCDGGYPSEAADEAVSYLRSYHYLDDMRYAAEFIRFKSSSQSRRQIMNKLMQKGIRKDVIEAAFAQFDEESSEEDGSSEKELIHRLIIKRIGTSLPDSEEKQKLYAYLYRKGFPVSLIDTVFSEIISDRSGVSNAPYRR